MKIEETNEDLTRYLSPISVWALSFGCAVGWGAFVMPGTQFLPLAGPLGTTIGLFIGAIIMILLGRNYHFLMQRFQGSGGTFTFTRKTFGYDHGFLSAWFLVLTYISIVWANLTALALITRAVFGDVLQFGFHYSLAGYDIYAGEVLFELVILIACGLVVAHRKMLASVIQTVLAILLITGILTGFFMVLSNIDSSVSVRPLFQPNTKPIGQIFNIITLAPWAFIGFESVSHSSREFKFPAKRVFAILLASIITGYVAYTLLNDIAVLSHPSSYAGWQDYIADLGNLSGRESMPVFYSIYSHAGNIGVIILTVTVISAILTGIIGNTIASSRLLFAMANNELIPSWFKKQAKDTTPKNAVIFIMLISCFIPFLGRTAIGWIVDVTSIGAVIAYGYTSAAAYKCAKESSHTATKITGIIGVILAVIFGAFLMIPNLVDTSSLSAESYLILTVWSILGFLFFRYVFKKDEHRRFGHSTVVWIVLLFIIFFTSLMWMRQETQRQTELSMTEINDHYIEVMEKAGVSRADMSLTELDEYVEKEVDEVSNTMTFNSIIQMFLIIVGLIIMISVYTLIMKRSRMYEIEKIKAEENSKAKSVFLSNMSHDIRTPMNAIIGYINLAKREDITFDEMREYMAKIEGSSGHLLALINDVLEMSRIESGKMELEPIETDLRRVLSEVRDMFMTQMTEKSISYTVTADDIDNSVVYCDKNRLNRVLLNLISNAYKFTPEGGNVTVRLRELKNAPVPELPETIAEDERTVSWYELRVADSGIGMTPEFAAKVFEAFERERTSTVSGIQGTGLGMAITKSIVDLMGGTIDVESESGKGTEFIIRIPFVISDTRPQETESRVEADTAEDKAVDFSGKRVLLVEDMEINKEIATMMLTQLGFTVETAANGAEAVHKVRGEEGGYFDVVLMDIQMPVMDGYDATIAIRATENESQAGVPIIAMTANAFSEDIKRAHDAGMNGHIAKPIDMNILVSTLKDIVG